MTTYLDVCIAAVREATGVCREIQSRLVHEDTLIKRDRSPVTVADFAAQAVVCRTLQRYFPEIPVVGEEDARDLKTGENRDLLQRVAHFLPGWSIEDIVAAIDAGTGAPGPLFFTLDPIDGTKGFLRGDQYAVALAMIRNGQVVAGVLGCPNLDGATGGDSGILSFAVRGEGAHATAPGGGEPRRLSVSGNDASGAVRFLESVESGHADHGRQADVKKGCGGRPQSVRIDSQAKYAVLARGDADVYLRLPSPTTPDYREKIWDHAAGVILVEEAGGRVTDMYGAPLDFSTGSRLTGNTGVIATNGVLHEEIVTHIRSSSVLSGR